VFICEQQFMATLIQVPRAIDRAWFAQLSLSNFMTSVFRSLFQAVAAAGGLPSDDTPQGLWIHNLTKAGGPLLEQVINELAVMPLPLPPNPRDTANSSAQNGQNAQNGQAAPVQLRAPSPAERRYASELLARLLDMGFMRRIGAAKRKMSQLPDGEEKITLLGDITTMETARKDLQTQVYGNVA
jgi:DNA primase